MRRGWAGRARFRGVLLAVALLAGAGGASGALLVGVASGRIPKSTSSCIPYRTKDIPEGTKCMIMPWQLAEAGPKARSVYITLAPGCFSGYRTWRNRPRRGIRIEAFAWEPATHHGRLDLTCGSGTIVKLRTPIDGRRIMGAHWPSRLSFGSLAHEKSVAPPLGLPRLLGLSPADARHVLWLWGFRSQLAGHGREIVAQLPGWGLVTQDKERPSPYSGVTKLTAGSHIDIPSKPVVPLGARTGMLSGEIQGPVSGALLAMFDAHGRLVARFGVRAKQRFHLRVTPGRYLFVDDGEGWIFCSTTRVRARPRRTVRVTVSAGCGIIY